MSSCTIRELALGPDDLGESIGWDARDGTLVRVDVLAGLVHQVADPVTDAPGTKAVCFDGEVGFALPRREGGLVVGVERTVWVLDKDGSRRELLELDDRHANRWNDAICDAAGRLWAGTIARDARTGAAALYRVDPDGSCEVVLRGLTNSNGLGWNGTGSHLRFVDSPTQRIDALEIDVDRGCVTARRPLALIPDGAGMPDGLCIDSDDGIWVALFGGGRVVRYTEDGIASHELQLPVPHPTNLCIGGPTGQEMFISTARHRLTKHQRALWPMAGRVLYTECGIAARPTFAFAG